MISELMVNGNVTRFVRFNPVNRLRLVIAFWSYPSKTEPTLPSTQLTDAGVSRVFLLPGS